MNIISVGAALRARPLKNLLRHCEEMRQEGGDVDGYRRQLVEAEDGSLFSPCIAGGRRLTIFEGVNFC